MWTRASSLVLCGLLLLAGAACGDGDDGERFALYHLESAIGPPDDEGELHCGPPRTACPGVITQRPRTVARYDVLAEPGLEGEGIDRARSGRLGVRVSIPFTAKGTEAFGRLTREARPLRGPRPGLAPRRRRRRRRDRRLPRGGLRRPPGRPPRRAGDRDHRSERRRRSRARRAAARGLTIPGSGGTPKAAPSGVLAMSVRLGRMLICAESQ